MTIHVMHFYKPNESIPDLIQWQTIILRVDNTRNKATYLNTLVTFDMSHKATKGGFNAKQHDAHESLLSPPQSKYMETHDVPCQVNFCPCPPI